MEQNHDPTTKPIKIERLQQSIDEIDIKINKLLVKKETLKNELDNAVKNELIAIVTSDKTPDEVLNFIKQARNGGLIVDLVKQKPGRMGEQQSDFGSATSPEQYQKRTEEGNDILDNDTNKI